MPTLCERFASSTLIVLALLRRWWAASDALAAVAVGFGGSVARRENRSVNSVMLSMVVSSSSCQSPGGVVATLSCIGNNDGGLLSVLADSRSSGQPEFVGDLVGECGSGDIAGSGGGGGGVLQLLLLLMFGLVGLLRHDEAGVASVADGIGAMMRVQ